MVKKLAFLLMHLVMLALVCAIGAYWAIRILTPAPASVPPPRAAAVLREPDPMLTARMFGLVQSAPMPTAVDVQALGVFAAGRDSAAVLAVDGKPARVYLLNQEVAGGRLVEVRKEAVTIEQGGVRRDVALPPPQALSTGGAPPPPKFRLDGNTLSAPTVAAGTQPATAQRQPPPPRLPPTVQPAPQPVPMQQLEPQQPQGAQPDQGDASAEPTERRGAKGRSLAQ